MKVDLTKVDEVELLQELHSRHMGLVVIFWGIKGEGTDMEEEYIDPRIFGLVSGAIGALDVAIASAKERGIQYARRGSEYMVMDDDEADYA